MAADFRAARPEKAARELVIVVHLYPVGDAALTSPSRSLESVIGHCIRYCGANGVGFWVKSGSGLFALEMTCLTRREQFD